ncbi:MAG TPA: 16S rRNA (uracil(1498)-N(3))-methyltransferase [Thauera sp.]|jgi:16S rRNA (uracil1498-N3)-methyltransferase|uniref:16S rRNA (uracil(1498)-N(3))-methyltransferase n=1 Tax=Thauera sp. TaxID=1905334 RepID=UPI000FB592D9|nr:16S rRNA (uracil(1498)-N(3))-methyltransferase [Thauera sp.]RTL25752.1 MAG: 16S rRNA (uracil(1498)-N(3))-methyltransferase [Rhodocyclaceae bacterium]MCB1944789.1 16S rRNA (uracil(1498)-N(3))-methyltransferase [Thauera sp.]MCP5224237.1 16S rRNA (uracil(1498)-N(3))-methyltransferase [Thauera sp.]HPE05077.1 16S rRNA (uracil(1498)-N(3))-methyltransferase [Thauera sp.]HRV78116.1 16S rRNA (uracil(1498)-N(3))-methyltransferase [Thauera sp.]
MISRFHFPDRLPAGGEVALPDALAHHALRVLRLRDGEAVVLFDGSGGEVEARLAVRGKAVFAQLGEARAVERESPLRIVLVQALASGDKMDWVVQKAVELGAHAVQPVQAERSVLRLAGERADKRVAHWQQVAVAACEQCGRNRVPEIRPLQALAPWLGAHRDALNYVLAPGGAAGFADEPEPKDVVHLLVGPEGGWSEVEIAAFDAAGCRPVRLGPRVLRTETAGLAAVAALQARWGDF